MAAKAEELKPWDGDLSMLYEDENPDDADHWYSGVNGGGMELGFGRLAGWKINEASLTYLNTVFLHRRHELWFQPYLEPYQKYLEGLRRFAGTDPRDFIVPFGKYKHLKLWQVPDLGYWEWAMYSESSRIFPIFFVAARKYLEDLQLEELEYLNYLPEYEEGADDEDSTEEYDERIMAADDNGEAEPQAEDGTYAEPDEPN